MAPHNSRQQLDAAIAKLIRRVRALEVAMMQDDTGPAAGSIFAYRWGGGISGYASGAVLADDWSAEEKAGSSIGFPSITAGVIDLDAGHYLVSAAVLFHVSVSVLPSSVKLTAYLDGQPGGGNELQPVQQRMIFPTGTVGSKIDTVSIPMSLVEVGSGGLGLEIEATYLSGGGSINLATGSAELTVVDLSGLT